MPMVLILGLVVVGLSDDLLIPPEPKELIVSKLKERKFSKKLYKMQCRDGDLEMLDSKSPESVLNEVMRKGKLDLGEDADLVQCPCRDNPAACFVVSDPRPGESNVFCCGCLVEQREERDLSSMLSKQTVFETFNLFKKSCGFWPFNLTGCRPYEIQKLLHFVLKQRDDVVVSEDAPKLSE